MEMAALKKVKALKSQGKLEGPEYEKLKTVLRKSSISQLSPFLDENGILRVGGRLDASKELSYDQKHQILVPQSRFAYALVKFLHQKYEHAGKQSLVSFVREKYWLIRGKNVINKVVHDCHKCFRANPAEIQQYMGNLPAARVTMRGAFTSTAVDYAGFYWIRASMLPRNAVKVKVKVKHRNV
jgi:Integrase zinc binding domain